MFTGIIEQQGKIQKKTSNRLHIEAARECIKELSLGASIAVNGACLTVSGFPSKSSFATDVMPETFTRTMLGQLRSGDMVNLELPLRLGERLGGHMVQGHIDGTAKLASIKKKGNSTILTFTAPRNILADLVEKGSVTINGISLTIIAVSRKTFSVGIIPHTHTRTTFAHISIDDDVNVEVDMVAKYIRSFTSSSGAKRHDK